MKNLLRMGCLLGALASQGACDGEAASHCRGAELQAALDVAAPGDVVTIGACEVEGTFTVPAGVTLTGTDRETSSLRSSDGDVVTLRDGSTLSTLTVYAGGTSGIRTASVNDTVIRGVTIHATQGAAVAIRGGRVTIDDSVLRGPVTDPADGRWLRVAGFVREGVCDGADCECVPGERDGDRVCTTDGRFATLTAIYGLYAEDVELTLTDVQVDRFAEFGAVLIQCETDWNGGTANDNLGTGIFVQGGNAHLVGVDVERTAEGLRGQAAYGILAGEAAVLTSEDVQLTDNERYGLVLLNASGVQTRLHASGNGDAGVWVGMAQDVSLIEATLMDNGFAGVVASGSENLLIEGGMIAGTRSVTRTLGDLFGVQEVGDGLHLSATTGIAVRNIVLRDNARGGMLVGLEGDLPTFESVDVEATTDGFGALAGTQTGGSLAVGAPDGWDSGIERGPTATANDRLAVDPLDIVGVPAPVSAQERVGIVFPMF